MDPDHYALLVEGIKREHSIEIIINLDQCSIKKRYLKKKKTTLWTMHDERSTGDIVYK